MVNFIFIALSFILFVASCNEEPASKTIPNTVKYGGQDLLWNGCAFLNEQEFTDLDNLRNQLNKNNTPEQDKPVFEEYIKRLTLVDKSDQELVNCRPGTDKERQQLMEHFVFLGLRYGRGEFSFVDNPRLASHFESEYFYLFPKRDFLRKTVNFAGQYSKADEIIARYLLGGTIAMQASLKMAQHDLGSIVSSIADGFKILKYGRTRIFTHVLFDARDNLKSLVEGFLAHDESFLKAYSALQQTPKGTYPMLLKKNVPYYPKDRSEVEAAQAKYVVGIGTSPGGDIPLGTGFFADLSGHTLFFTSGHWNFNRQLYIRRQINADPLGSAETKFVWSEERLDIFNFSEQLFVPTLKALEFSLDEINRLLKVLGTSPYAKIFLKFTELFPWIDSAIALPSQSLIQEIGLVKKDLYKLSVFQENSLNPGLVYGFGTTENLESYGHDKPAGIRRLSAGTLEYRLSITSDGYSSRRLFVYTPITLGQLNFVPYKGDAFSAFSMRFGPRGSGSPIVTRNNNIIGLLQGSLEDENKKYLGIRSVHFTTSFLALIGELIADARGLHGIPEAELVALVRKHMFNDVSERKKMHQELVRATGL